MACVCHESFRLSEGARHGLNLGIDNAVTKTTNEVPIHTMKRMSQLIGVRAVLMLHKIQFQILASLLEKIRELLDFDT